ncbi:ribonuclease E/G [Rhodobium gokarnense]|uniref:Ribonuclease E n=1 Tax=Rhodobium gokarnense TaxID=364296 RepID=A0ABT3HAR0_9HYPH|nr:ribonuclease E/G [Rhodobium gokarnense]MCW2307409.1 ribonuclease E [Rhodobium gokarnense]
MANKMLIDAAHPEETRVVVVRGNRVEEFDFEAANRKQLRGNIYLAKVTRVEPSLQAAFVDYGGNRHGFLAFSEIHPDYYQIPVADRQALLDEEAAEEAAAKEEDVEDDEASADEHGEDAGDHDDPDADDEAHNDADADDEDDSDEEPDHDDEDGDDDDGDEPSGDDDAPRAMAASAGDGDTVTAEADELSDDGESDDDAGDGEKTQRSSSRSRGRRRRRPSGRDRGGDRDDDDQVESVGAEDALEEVPQRGLRRRRQYKIQEVIRRRQVLLVQVVKEERGNKGAALTTYLSLAGRYSVLMPNTARGGGISRKITNPTDRKRLKKVASDLAVPEGMGVILRTAGASRTKSEIKRDFEYLLRLWENVRDLTLQSSAPSLVYEEGSLIKRSIRDLYNKDIDEVSVSGEEGYREAKDFMRMLMPSHSKHVQPYRDATPLFTKHGVEAQLDAMFSPQVTLPSGGYIVINQTEALVAIDVNSGRATREHNIEDTALATNMEAASEVARQLRLRDLAGLIVIDFIDMEEKRNNRSVERKLKECLKSDRARIQVGRISHFGLMEMSRQRIRTGVLESSTEVCPTCRGTGTVRSTESVALHVLRALEDHLMRGVKHHLRIRTRTEVALYILNQKRPHLADLESRFGLTVAVFADEMINGEHFILERGDPIERVERPGVEAIAPDQVRADEIDMEEDEDDSETDTDTDGDEKKSSSRRRRRRPRRRSSSDRDGYDRDGSETSQRSDEGEDELAASDDSGDDNGDGNSSDGDDGDNKRRRRRGRRGGRRNRRNRSDKDDARASEGDEDRQDGSDQDGSDQDNSDADGGDSYDSQPVAEASDVSQGSGDAGDAAAPVAANDDDTSGPEEAAGGASVAEETSETPDAGEAEPVRVEEAEDVPAAEAPSGDNDAATGEEDDTAPAAASADGETDETAGDVAGETPSDEADDGEGESGGTKRSGWWQRRSFF